MQYEVIQMCHAIGHFGIKKTHELLTRDYFIPDVDEKIRTCIDNCVKCILIERKRGRREGLLNPIPKGDVPLDTLHIDHLGPMPSTNKNFNHILTMIDAFTKFVWLFPVKATTTEETIQKMKVQMDVFGCPRRVIADRGSAFTSNAFNDFCTDQGIELHFITTGVARGNGQVERVHNTLIPTLAKLSIDDPTKWYRYVGQVQRFYNCTHQRAINSTPFEMMIGTRMRIAEDVRIAEIVEEELRRDFCDSREELRKRAVEAIQQIQTENKNNYDRKSKEAIQHQVGAWVSIMRTQFGTGMKLRPKFLGPYRVIKRIGPDRYALQKEGGEGPYHTTSSADNMKPWPGGNGVPRMSKEIHPRASGDAGGPNVG